MPKLVKASMFFLLATLSLSSAANQEQASIPDNSENGAVANLCDIESAMDDTMADKDGEEFGVRCGRGRHGGGWGGGYGSGWGSGGGWGYGGGWGSGGGWGGGHGRGGCHRRW